MFVTDTPIYTTAIVLTPRSVQVMWNTIYIPCNCVTGYLISYITSDSYSSCGNVIVNDANQTNHTLTNLEEYTEYDIIVRVISRIGTTDNNNGFTVTTYSDGKFI